MNTQIDIKTVIEHYDFTMIITDKEIIEYRKVYLVNDGMFVFYATDKVPALISESFPDWMEKNKPTVLLDKLAKDKIDSIKYRIKEDVKSLEINNVPGITKFLVPVSQDAITNFSETLELHKSSDTQFDVGVIAIDGQSTIIKLDYNQLEMIIKKIRSHRYNIWLNIEKLKKSFGELTEANTDKILNFNHKDLYL